MNLKKFWRPAKSWAALFALLLLLAGCGTSNLTTSHSSSGSNRSKIVANTPSKPEQSQPNFNNRAASFGGITQAQIKELAQKNYQSGSPAFIDVNGGKSTLNPNSWQTNHVIYSNLDNLNRTSSPNTAFLEAHNYANDSLRVRQTVQPTGWHYNNGDNQIYNRGHLIAYSLSAGINQDGDYNPNSTSGDQNNPKNLFTQTAFANQEVQTIYEEKVRNAIKQNKKVIYQATPIFRGDELMARGVNLQAISTDGSLNFNVYIFNIQPHYIFNYADGSSHTDPAMQVPTPAGAPHFNDNQGGSSYDNNYQSDHRYSSKYYFKRGYQSLHHFRHFVPKAEEK